MSKIKKCRCKEILGREKLILHLHGCPESVEYKEYQKLSWYKKIFRINPYHFYEDHLCSARIEGIID